MVIAEIGLAHEGSLGIAFSFVDAVAAAGADAVKFQTHIAAAESTPAEQFRVHFSPEDPTRADYWERTAFSEEQWAKLADYSRSAGLKFSSSPFSEAAVELLERIGVDFWKIASGEVGHAALVERTMRAGAPVLISSGLSSLNELDQTVDRARYHGVPFTVLQCTSRYPCPPEEVGLNLLEVFRARYGCEVGLSDHTGEIYAGLAAVALGASVVEVHVTLSEHMFGPDVPASLTVEQLKKLTEGIRFTEAILDNPVDKDQMAEVMAPLRAMFGRSIVAARHLDAGTIVSSEDLALKKPGTGLREDVLSSLIGRRLKSAVAPDVQLSWGDFQAQPERHEADADAPAAPGAGSRSADDQS